jgi:hypothetical protein
MTKQVLAVTAVLLSLFFTHEHGWASVPSGFYEVKRLRSVALEGNSLKFSYVVGQDPNNYETQVAVELLPLSETSYGPGMYSAQLKVYSKGPQTSAFMVKNDGVENLDYYVEQAKNDKRNSGFAVNGILSIALPPVSPNIQSIDK